MTATSLALLIAAALALILVTVGAMRFLDGVPRSRWLSGAGGAAVAYIFLHLLPDLAAAHRQAGIESERFYFVRALAGLVAFYGIERQVRAAGGKSPGVFWLHVGSFGVYNLLIG